MAGGSKNAAAEEPEAKKPQDPPAGGLHMPAPVPPLEAEAFPGQSELPEDERDRVLVLHVSLPRTVMTWDMTMGRSTEVELNRALAEMAWGSLESEGGDWTLESEDPTLEPPHEALISYAEYVARSFPTDGSVDLEEEREQNARAAAAKLAVFTNQGEPGARFRPMFDQMVKNLTHSNKALAKAYDIKKPILNEDEAPEDPAKSEAQAIMRFGRHQILPSFWQLLISLAKKGRRFFLVFRSFGREQVSAFQRELQLFCQGQHPAYCGLNKTQKPPPMNGDKGSRDMRLTDGSIGCVKRKDGCLEFADRVIPELPPGPDGTPPPDAETVPRQTVYPFPPYHEAYAGLQEHVLSLANSAAIVDDLQYWEANDRNAEAGKLLLVDHGGGLAETKVQHILFDGHIGRVDAGCVDVRDVVQGKPIPFPEADGVFLHRVDLFQATTDTEYFIKSLEACEMKMSQRILESKRVAEAAAEGTEQQAAMAPPKEYLYHNVIPALLPALEACQRDRPADPIEFIAFYMLRHSKQYSKKLKS